MAEPKRPDERGRIAPLAIVAVALGGGVVLDRVVNPWETSVWGVLVLGLAGVTLTLILVRRWRRAESVALVLICGALGAGWHHERWADRAADDLSRTVDGEAWSFGERRVAWLRGVVVDEATFRPGRDGPKDEGSTRVLIGLTAIHDAAVPNGWRSTSGTVQAYVNGDRSDLITGCPVETAGMMTRIDGPLNPGEFDSRPMLQGRGIRLRLLVDGPSGIWDDPTGSEWPWTKRLGAVRRWSYRTLATGLDPATLPLAAALLLGRREAVDPDINDAFARTGTTHLLAISGLHLQALAWVMASLALAMGVKRRSTFLLVAGGTVAYAALVGFAPSVVRSAAMTVGACLAGWRHRCRRPGNMLGGALVATLLWNPSDLFDVGCQLSFLAVAAVIWLVPEALSWDAPQLLPLDVLERQTQTWWRIRRRVGLAYLRASLVGSAVVWLAAWPLVALRFHLVSPVAILANLPLIPLTSLALLLSGLTLALSAIWTPLGVPFAWLCGKSLTATEFLVRWGMKLPNGHGFVPGPPASLVGVFYVLLSMAMVTLACRWQSRRVRFWLRGASACGLTLAILPLIPVHPEVAEAEVCAVGHGLAVIVQSPSGQTALYDAGKLGDPHVGRRIVAPVLWSKGISRIDALILSHADADHFNGVPDLLDRFAIGSVRIPPGFEDPTNPGAERLIADIRERGIPVEPIGAGDVIDLGAGLTMTARLPEPGDHSGTDNARSVVLDVTRDGRTLLLTGDLERDGLTKLLRLDPPIPPVAAIVAPHHGGRTSNPPALYTWANPLLVAVSQRSPIAGVRDPLAFLETPGKDARPLLRTWQTGAIRFRWTSTGLQATGFLGPLKQDQPTQDTPPKLAGFGLTTWPPWLVGLAGLIGGAALALVVIVVEWGAWSLVAPGRRIGKPDAEPLPPARPHERITHRATDGAILVGDWFPSAGPSRDRTILLLHGLAEDRRTFEVRVDRLVNRGWNVAALDARASGESGGQWVTFGGREIDDVRGWLDTLTALIPLSPRFAVWGRSMGAATALRAAATDPRIKTLILEAPYTDLRAAVANVISRLRVPGSLATLILARAHWLAGVSLDRPRPLDLAPQVQIPALVIHGTRDRLVLLSLAQALANLIGRDHPSNPPAEFLAVPEAGHANVFAIGGDPLAEAIADFLDRALPRA